MISDPHRIDRILNLLSIAWKHDANLSLMEVICQLTCTNFVDIGFHDDDKIETFLRRRIKVKKSIE